MTTAEALSDAVTTPWRSAGYWMAVLIVVLMAVNAVRAFSDPVGFAAYLGLPLTDQKDTGFVNVYGLRAAFLGLFAAVLLIQQDLNALKWFALAAVIMPIGDAYLVSNAGAPTATLIRHVAIAIYLVATFYMLHRWTGRTA